MLMILNRFENKVYFENLNLVRGDFLIFALCRFYLSGVDFLCQSNIPITATTMRCIFTPFHDRT